VLSDLPIGTWTSATLLDLLGGEGSAKAAELLIGLGILSSLPTAASGLSDWADTQEGERRVGLIHALTNTAALGLLTGSFTARRRGNHRFGVLLGLAGTSVATAGAYLGGHLTMGLGVGSNQAAFEDGFTEWTDVALAGELIEGQPTKVTKEGTQLVLVKRGPRLYGLSSRCSHLGGPLDDGEVEGRQITCPWHASTFDLDDGSVIEGPARCPQPAYEVRERDGRIEVRLRQTVRA
jgi:nitrite reductase/ring-hydroxylating ferredoxin subunit